MDSYTKFFDISLSPSCRTTQALFGYITLICIYLIFKKAFYKNNYWAFLGALLFTSLPINFPKISLICLPYIFCTSLFYFSFTVNLYKKNNLTLRLITLILFFFSSFTNSLLVFYGAFIITFYTYDKKLSEYVNLKNTVIFIFQKIDFILLPFLFALLKLYVFPNPTQEFSGYNTITFSNRIYLGSFQAFIFVLKNIFYEEITTFIIVSCILVLVPLSKFFLSLKSKAVPISRELFLKNIIYFFFFSLFAIIPYILVGRTGKTYGLEWEGRDTLLMPIGLSIFLLLPVSFLLTFSYLETTYKKYLLVSEYLSLLSCHFPF